MHTTNSQAGVNLGLVGSPVKASQSSYLYEQYHQQGRLEHHPQGQYLLIQCDTTPVLEALFSQFHLLGLNVTAPLKQAFWSQLTRWSDEAERTGAINCIRPHHGGFEGHNSDLAGVQSSLQRVGDASFWQGREVYVLGAGGAARSVIVALRNVGASITVVNRHAARAEKVAQALHVHWQPWGNVTPQSEEAVLYSTLPGGSTLPPIAWQRIMYILDSTYYNSPVAPYAQQQHIPYTGGWTWLVEQAVESYRYFYCAPLSSFAPIPPQRLGHALHTHIPISPQAPIHTLRNDVVYQYNPLA